MKARKAEKIRGVLAMPEELFDNEDNGDFTYQSNALEAVQYATQLQIAVNQVVSSEH